MASIEPLADERRRDSVPAPDLEDAVIRSDLELLDDRPQSLTHGALPCSIHERMPADRLRCRASAPGVAPQAGVGGS